MTWVDTLVLAVLACSALLAFLRGFVREALGICAWAGAAYFATFTFHLAQPEVRKFIANQEVADPVAFGLVFLFALIAFSIIASLIARMVRLSALGGLDRTIGVLFGVLRGAVLVCAAYIGAGMLFSVKQWPAAVLDARSLPYAYQGAQWLAARLPSAYQPPIEAPPDAPPPGATDLLRSIPRGFARDGRTPQADPTRPPATSAGPGGR